MDEASLMMEEAMELDDFEVEITPTAVNNKPSTSTGFSLPLITLNEESQEESQEESEEEADEDEDDKVEVVIPIKNNNKIKQSLGMTGPSKRICF